jgi:hypothetical protein
VRTLITGFVGVLERTSGSGSVNHLGDSGQLAGYEGRDREDDDPSIEC